LLPKTPKPLQLIFYQSKFFGIKDLELLLPARVSS